MLYHAELTDTFAGEANYCWLHRATFEAESDASPQTLIRRAKKALRTNYSFRTTADCGDLLRADSPKSSVVLFIFPATN